MTTSAIRLVLEPRFSTKWAAATPIAWENLDYTPVSGTTYVTFRIIPNSGNFASLGHHPLVRTLGMIEINIMTPFDGRSGAEPGNVLADNAIAIFKDSTGRGWKSSGITCEAGYLMDSRQEGDWYRHIVLVEFQYNEYF